MSSLSLARLVAFLLPNALLWGAIGSQIFGGLHPCEMCMWQRWPHAAAIGAAMVAIALYRHTGMSAVFTVLAALFIATSGIIGAFHAGVEYGWWQGLTSCATTGGPVSLESIMNAPLVRCDVAPWTLGGISLAGFNALFSLGGAALIVALVLRGGKRGA